MSAEIVLAGLAANNPIPGVYTEVNFAAGPASGAGGARSILVIANMAPAGQATPNTVIYGPDTPTALITEPDMIRLAGAGSEAHRMFLRMTLIPSTVPVYWIFVPQSAGASATATLTVTGPATANCTVRTFVGDAFIDTAVSVGDTATIIGTNIAANVNSQSRWAVTASAAAGVVTLTSVQHGPRANWIRYMTQVISTVATGITVTGGTDAYMTGGTTADSNATALATVAGQRFNYIVSAAEDATQLGAVATQVLAQATATNGRRQTCFGASVDTLANAQTIAVGINSARCEIAWLQESTWTPAEIAAYTAILYATLENAARPRNNFSLFPATANDQAYWQIPAPRDQSVAPTTPQFLSALNNGITPIAVVKGGKTQLVKRATTRSLNGASADYRIRDPHRRTIPDFFADDLSAKVALNFGGKDLADDPPKGAPQPGPNVVTPTRVRNATIALIDFYDQALNLLKNVPTIKANSVYQRSGVSTNRLNVAIPLQCIDIADQFELQINQVA